ncbi:MAG: trypsin-like peptidase domain-containing protein [Planctomycetota bacterium]
MDPIALGKENSLADSLSKDGSQSRRLVTHRYRAHTGAEVDVAATNAERDSLVKKLEKISGKADFLPTRYLSDGLARARAVCRITGPMGMGTGFLIGRGLIMTNNHVLANTSDAQASIAEFDFEQDKVKIGVRLRPERLFITDAALDFTIVGCDDLLITEIQPIKLLRNPATIAEGENVSIVQHPSGRMKEIALRSNEVTSVQSKVIQYRTDTEPGSSGSPAFNDRWELVALHHAGWTEPGGQATNEGIRVASIVAKLKSQNFSGLSNSELGRELWESIDDTSPYLGFFDVVGLKARPEEIEVPDFVGSDNFADIGFWNIEPFNNNVSQERIDRVTSVLARLSMDALGLVEVEKGALRKACRALARRGLQYDFEIGDGPGSQDLAVLYDRETTTDQPRRYPRKVLRSA